MFVAEGEKCVSELAGSFGGEAIVATAEWLDGNRHTSWLTHFDTIYTARPDQLARISTLSTPPQVMAIFRMPQSQHVVSPLPKNLYIALDGVRDPGNLGTIIRTADWFGIHSIFCSHDTVDAFNAKTVQSSMGSLARVRVFYTSLTDLFAANGAMPVFGTLLEGTDIYTTPLSEFGFIVMGNEGTGLSRQVRSLIDVPLLLPPWPADSLHHAESLNVAIATALVTAEFRRRTVKSL